MHIYIHTGIYQHVSVPRCPSTLQNCFAFHELLGPNYKSFHNFCSFPGATFPPTSWISPKKIFKKPKSDETLGKLQRHFAIFTTHFGWFQDASSWLPFDTGGRIGPLRLVLAALLALDAHRRPAASDLLDNPVFRRQARSSLGFFQVPGENDWEDLSTEKKTACFKWRSWKLLPFFGGGIESKLIQMLRVILRHFFSTKLLGVGNI